ncbi:alkaline phosphatase family protein [Candidatus Poribacteria bacterium]|nr:alkaline phosphatase family protein [Candidatus Poribacteria bacterium]
MRIVFRRGGSQTAYTHKLSSRLLILPFLAAIAVSIIVGMSLSSCGAGNANPSKKVIVLGIDGMDPNILDRLMADGKMPNFAELARSGSYTRLGTSIPPQSPVAWSDFITGMDPGGHSIFDFIHREPGAYLPYLSTSKAAPSKHSISLGEWVIPLSSGSTDLLRKGTAFWQILEARGTPTTVIKVPANFPPAESRGRSLSGMGTPDILGTYGTFSFYTDNPEKFENEDVTGGEVYPVEVVDNMVKSRIIGPRNAFRKDQPKITIDFSVYIDPENSVAKVVVQNKEILVNVGEWSDWIHVKFTAVPFLQSVSGICRFYLKEVRPAFALYVTPINIDPLDPALPISTPGNYSAELAEEVGCFYTQGMPADTKAFSVDALGVKDYLSQARIVLHESVAMYEHVFETFDSGLLFFYFSSLDQNSHMLWWLIDPKHPMYDAKPAKEYGHFLDDLYIEMDKVLGKAQKKVDANTTLIVLSDHGFAAFYRTFGLNTWLKENGYVTLLDDSEGEFYSNVDWEHTRAYGLGLNGLYVNERGREGSGIVEPSEKDNLLDEIERKLLAVRDSKTGEQVVLRLYKTKDVYTNPDASVAPDAIVGYNRNYRASWETALGSFPKEIFLDNDDRWSGDHCIAAELVPGVLLSNRKVRIADPVLRDLTPTILAEFGIEPPRQMTGRPIF